MADRVLVDTSVWVEVLRNPSTPLGTVLRELIDGTVRVHTTGLIVQEVLQGTSVPSEGARVSSLMASIPYFPMTRETHLRAAALYRKLRVSGVTVPSIDVALAQLALDQGARLWSLDAHFDAIASASKLKLFRF
jgi:predicted nucleic acid-binding protein